MPEKFINSGQSTLLNAISDVATSFVVHDGSSFNPSDDGSFRVLIDSEIIRIASVSGDTFTVAERGAEDTVAQAHDANADVKAVVTAGGILQGIADNATHIAVTANRALISNGSGNLAPSATTSTELGYVSGVTSAIQTQLNAKQPTITGAASTIASSNLTANHAVVSDVSGKVAVSAVTDTELGYVSGVTSALQTQLGAKQPLDSTLTALAGFNSNGIVAQTAADTFTARTITGTLNQVQVNNGNGVSGNPTLSLPQSIDTNADVLFHQLSTGGNIGAGGFVSADNGAVITSGDGSGDLTAQGTITAAHFVGDGTGLTGVAHTLTAGDATAGFVPSGLVYIDNGGLVSNDASITTDGAGTIHAVTLNLDSGAVVLDGANVTVSTGGDVFTVGNITSSTGLTVVSGVTSLDSGAVTTNASGTVTATAFVGDGAGLTNIDPAHVTGLADVATSGDFNDLENQPPKTLDVVSTWAFDDTNTNTPDPGKFYYDGSADFYLNKLDANGKNVQAAMMILADGFETSFLSARNETQENLFAGFGVITDSDTDVVHIHIPVFSANASAPANADVFTLALTPNQNDQPLNTFNDVEFQDVNADTLTAATGLTVTTGITSLDGGLVATNGSGTLTALHVTSTDSFSTDGNQISTNGTGTLTVGTGLTVATGVTSLDGGTVITTGSGGLTAATVTSVGILSADAGDIISDGTGGLTVDTLTAQTNLTVTGTLTDGASAVGTSGQVLTSTGTGTAWADNTTPFLPYFSWVFDIAEDTFTTHPTSGKFKMNSSGSFTFASVNYFTPHHIDANSITTDTVLDAALNSGNNGNGAYIYLFNADFSKRAVYRYTSGAGLGTYSDMYYFNLTYSGSVGSYFSDGETVYMNWNIGALNGVDGGEGPQGPQGDVGADGECPDCP